MLDPWIIEEIRRREEEQRQRDDRLPRLEIQIETPEDRERPSRRDSDQPKRERGVAIIDFAI